MLLNEPKPLNLFLFPPIIGYGIGYRSLAAHLNNVSVYAFNYIQDQDKLVQYAQYITSIQDQGPYLLGGYSAGGNLAFEVAKELEKQGREVSALIILDSFPKDFLFSHGSFDENQTFQKVVTRAMSSMGLQFSQQDVIGTLNHFSGYYNGLINRGTLNAPIYSIYAEDREERECGIIAKETGEPYSRKFPGWEKYTSQICRNFPGIGTHATMFTPGCVERNAEIVEEILEGFPISLSNYSNNP
jgi:thioesterase domain-containing protein